MTAYQALFQALIAKELEEQAKPPYGALTFNRETAFRMKQKGDKKKALKYLENAQKVEPTDRKTLLLKSQVNNDLTNYDEALIDCKKLMDMDPDYLHALFEKAATLFEKGEFELGLMHFHRGLKERKKPKNFEVKRLQAEETIEDCIGRHVGPALANMYPTIKKMEESKKSVSLVETEENLLSEKKANEEFEKAMTFKYLSGLHDDLMFLEKLQNMKGVVSPNKEGTAKILQITEEAYSFLKERREALRKRRPYYAMQHRWETIIERLKRRQKEERVMTISRTREEAKRFIQRLWEICEKRDIKYFLDHAERAIEYVSIKNTRTELPNKRTYLRTIYNVIALTYLDQKTFFIDWFDEKYQKIVIRLFFDLPVFNVEERVLSVYNKFCRPFRSHRDVIQKCNIELKKTADKHRRLFLLHEIANEKSLIQNYEASKSKARECLSEARALGHMAWAFNATMLIVKSAIRMKNKKEALEALEAAKEIAIKLERSDAVNFINKCRDFIEVFDMEEIKPIHKTREEEIKQIMQTEELRQRAKQFMAYRSHLPEKKRLSLAYTGPAARFLREVITLPTS